MYINTLQAPISVAQAAKDDSRVNDLVQQVVKGEIYGQSPSGFDTVVWTSSDVERLDAALERRAEKRAAKAAQASLI